MAKRAFLRPTYQGTITHRVDTLGPRRVPSHGPEGNARRPSTGDEAVYIEAEDRFEQCLTWEKDSRRLFLEDLKFAEADPDNGFQWPNHMRRNRDVDRRPALTVNKTRQHNLQIINDLKQNKASIKINPVGQGASFRSAEVYSTVVRHIETTSTASVAYDMAVEFQVKGGIGYWTVDCEYEDNETFNQIIKVKEVPDPLGVLLDRDIKRRNGSDARYGFTFEDHARDAYQQAHPEHKEAIGLNAFSTNSWLDADHVRVATYWRKSEKRDQLIILENAVMDPGSGNRADEGIPLTMSQLKEILPDAEMRRQLLAMPGTRKRRIVTDDIEWFKIVGRTVVEKGKWAGKYIPIVRVVGEETVIEGKLDRKGHTRNLKDPQRIYNYWTSAAVEHIALQGKTPWIASAEAIEGYETYWATANTVNHSFLPYNAVGDNDVKLEPPQRPSPPQFSEAYLKGMEVAGNELMMASGQYQAQMGEKENARSGVAISERQRQGDNATYHFYDNFRVALAFTGEILVDLIPKIYDTKRVLMCMALDGKGHEVTIDPKQQDAHQEIDNTRTLDAVKSIFNPGVGKYMVEAESGPNYATQRQEASEAFTKVITARPELMNVVGDIFFRVQDFPLADEAAERIKRTIPANVLGEGPTDAEQQLTQQVQQYQAMLEDAATQIAKYKVREETTKEKREIGAYQAITHRIDVLAKMILNPKDAAKMWHDVTMQSQRMDLSDIDINKQQAGNDPNQQQSQQQQGQQQSDEPPVPGARKAKDNNWYVPDPSRQGKFMQVTPDTIGPTSGTA